MLVSAIHQHESVIGKYLSPPSWTFLPPLQSKFQFSPVQLLSRVWLFVIPWTVAHQASLSITNFQNLFKLTSIKLVMPSSHLSLCHPLLLPSVFPSIRVFSNESLLHIRWSKYWSFCISPSNEYSALLSFRIDWFDLLAVHGNLNSLQHHSSKTSVLRAQPSLWSNSHIWTWLWKNHSFD